MRRLFAFFAVLVLAPFRAHPEPGLDFAAAARMAVEASSELRNEYAARTLREGAWLWGIRAFLPKLSLSVSEDDRVSEIGTDSFLKNYSVNVEQLVWDGGRLSLSRKLEKMELDLAGNKLKQMASDIADGAVSAYRDLLQVRTILEIREKTRESLDEQRRIMMREAELGLVRLSDVVEADITVALAEIEILSMAMDMEEAEWKLADRLGLEQLPLLSEQIDTQRSLRLPSPVKAGIVAESRNQELAAIRHSVTRRRAEARAVSHSWVPSLRLTGSFGLNGRQYPLSRYNWSVGFIVDFSSPWVSGNLGGSAGKDPPHDRNARLQQTLNPVPEPAAVFSIRSAALALIHEQSRYETALKEIYLAADRGVKKCLLLDKKRVLAIEALELEAEKFRLAELRLSLGEITHVELMEARLDYAKREAAIVEAAAAVLQAERELERLLDLGPGELSALAEDII